MYEQVISFDLDGVLANFTRAFTRIAHDLFGTPVGGEQSQQNWMFEDFPELGLDRQQCAINGPIWTKVKKSVTFWADLDPLNVSIMSRINTIRNKVFITNRPGVNPLEQSVYFLEKWGIEDPYVIVADQKAPIAIEYNVVAHIDDYIKNVRELKDAKVRYTALYYAPYNKIHHEQWKESGGEIVLSVDHFIDECDARGYTRY